jgi:hypothetical protein
MLPVTVAKGSYKEMFPVYGGKCWSRKAVPSWWQTFRWWRRGWNGGLEMVETTVKRLLFCGFKRTGKAMGQVYQCWWRIYREINVFFQVRISFVLRFIRICNLFTDSLSYIHFWINVHNYCSEYLSFSSLYLHTSIRGSTPAISSQIELPGNKQSE